TGGDDNISWGTLVGTTIYGFGGNDNISTGHGDDILDGGNGNDSLYANDGND
ncbi:MAG TPA: calcium-binding protein, partial [Firmicutes bacterium]|nr:calcium-binding protein [Bacillota bacterium]